MKRIFINIFVFLSFIFLPWYVYIFLIFLGLIFIDSYFESVIWALLVDSVYSISHPGLFYGKFGFWTTLFSGLIILRAHIRERVFIR